MHSMTMTYVDPESFARGGPTLHDKVVVFSFFIFRFFLLFFAFLGGLMRGREAPESNYHSLKAGHHWRTSETPFQWRFAGAPMIAQH